MRETQFCRAELILSANLEKKMKVSNEILCIALHKNKTANVMLAQLGRHSYPTMPSVRLAINMVEIQTLCL